MLQADVTLTDFALAVECAVFTILLMRRRAHDRVLYQAFAAFFAALGLSSLAGALWHGAFSNEETVAARWVWLTTMTGLAFAAMALWRIAAALLPSGPWPDGIRRLARGQLVLQSCISAFVTDAFAVAAIGILPPLVLVKGLYVERYHATHDDRVLVGIAGFVLAALSGLVLLFDYSLHPQWATPNAVYHLLQFAAFWLVFISVSAVSSQPR
jgi:hypothetical protein